MQKLTLRDIARYNTQATPEDRTIMSDVAERIAVPHHRVTAYRTIRDNNAANLVWRMMVASANL